MQLLDHEAAYLLRLAAKDLAEQEAKQRTKRAHEMADVGPQPKNRAERRRLEKAMRKVKRP